LEFVWETASAVYRQHAKLKKTKEDYFHQFLDDPSHATAQKQDITRLYNELKDESTSEERKLELVWYAGSVRFWFVGLFVL
jgi:hypothetical protein